VTSPRATRGRLLASAAASWRLRPPRGNCRLSLRSTGVKVGVPAEHPALSEASTPCTPEGSSRTWGATRRAHHTAVLQLRVLLESKLWPLLHGRR